MHRCTVKSMNQGFTKTIHKVRELKESKRKRRDVSMFPGICI